MSVRHVVSVIGLLMMLVSGAMALAALVSLGYRDGATVALFASAVITAITGAVAHYTSRFRDDIGAREGFAIVTFAWTTIAIFGSLPYLLSGTIDGIIPAVFESMSGFTTTGATVLSEIESLPHGVLLWRSITQWLGGMGIIVLVIAVLPFLGVGGMQLFRAEVPGLTPERLRPRITQTAKLLWFVYLGLTATQVVLYLLGGMSAFDAVNHSFTTLATGGFSTKNVSLAAYDSAYIQYVTIAFMYMAGVNFALHFRAVSGKPMYLRDPEWRFYSLLILIAAGSLLLFNLGGGSYGLTASQLELAFRDSLFQATSIITTTGFVSMDYELWGPAAVFLLVWLMFSGGMAGSTGGGVKIVRIMLVLKHTAIEIRKHLHPRAVYLARLGNKVVREDVMANVMGFVILYGLLVLGGSLVLTILGIDMVTAFGASASTVGNIGPGIGDVGAVDNYGWMSDPALLLLTFLMLVGRLEIYTVLLLFHAQTWRRNGSRLGGSRGLG